MMTTTNTPNPTHFKGMSWSVRTRVCPPSRYSRALPGGIPDGTDQGGQGFHHGDQTRHRHGAGSDIGDVCLTDAPGIQIGNGGFSRKR